MDTHYSSFDSPLLGRCMGTNAVSDLRHSRRLFWYADAHHAGDERTSSITNNRRNCSVTRVCQHWLYIFILDVSSFQLFVNCQHWQYLSFLCFNLGTTVLCMWYWELIIKLLMRILTSNVWMIVIYYKGNSHFQLCHFSVGGYLRETLLYLYHSTRCNFDWFQWLVFLLLSLTVCKYHVNTYYICRSSNQISICNRY